MLVMLGICPRLPAIAGKFPCDARAGPPQTCRNCAGFESLLKLGLNQRTIIQCDVFVFFLHAAFSHKRMLHLVLERALPKLI